MTSETTVSLAISDLPAHHLQISACHGGVVGIYLDFKT